MSDTYIRTMLIAVTCFALGCLREFFVIVVVIVLSFYAQFLMIRAVITHCLLSLRTQKTRHMQLRVRISKWKRVVQNQGQKCWIIQHYDNCHTFNVDLVF